jgi:hypothetical protein
MSTNFCLTCVQFSSDLVGVDVAPPSHINAASNSASDLVLTKSLCARSITTSRDIRSLCSHQQEDQQVPIIRIYELALNPSPPTPAPPFQQIGTYECNPVRKAIVI